jgi:diphthine synthase
MVLYLIGLGLGDEKDITVKGLEIVKKCKHVFLEHYTAILGSVPLTTLEEFYADKANGEERKKITIADREMVESQAELIIKNAKTEDVAFLVVGDPFA